MQVLVLSQFNEYTCSYWINSAKNIIKRGKHQDPWLRKFIWILAWEDVINLPEVQRFFIMCLMQPKGKVSTVHCKSFLQRWMHFPLDQVNYIQHNLTIAPLHLITVTNANNMWRSNTAKEEKNANGTLR